MVIIHLLIWLKKPPMVLFTNIIFGITILLKYLILGQNDSGDLLRLNITKIIIILYHLKYYIYTVLGEIV